MLRSTSLFLLLCASTAVAIDAPSSAAPPSGQNPGILTIRSLNHGDIICHTAKTTDTNHNAAIPTTTATISRTKSPNYTKSVVIPPAETVNADTATVKFTTTRTVRETTTSTSTEVYSTTSTTTTGATSVFWVTETAYTTVNLPGGAVEKRAATVGHVKTRVPVAVNSTAYYYHALDHLHYQNNQVYYYYRNCSDTARLVHGDDIRDDRDDYYSYQHNYRNRDGLRDYFLYDTYDKLQCYGQLASSVNLLITTAGTLFAATGTLFHTTTTSSIFVGSTTATSPFFRTAAPTIAF
ncbi:hypothetical protein LTR09_011956 [Extremus antarcticus]|uniref:Uncharacterized protein n=1 Tax=Extremus antarcticus TaxID=702011 RepID=A0AAJ0G7G7_9PEZI|nr:hypothetical protein LTR09_011956 [Extremus antarcticus]